MLTVSRNPFNASTIINNYAENSIERDVLNKMSAGRENYSYDNVEQLEFELKLRREIVNTAIQFSNSKLSFSDFKNSKCNPTYWERTANGGFLLKRGILPSDAVNDFLKNSEQYSTECATALEMLYYKALLNVFGSEIFNKTFPSIYVMDWDVKEPLLTEIGDIKKVSDFLLGDRGYFNNPDFHPEKSQWRGENVIILPNGLYYGHGLGIGREESIISALNENRKEGASRSAFLMDEVARPNFKKLYNAYKGIISRNTRLVWAPFPAPITVR